MADLANLTRCVGLRPLAAVRRRLGKRPADSERSSVVPLVENEGTERLPLTRWILGHRGGRAVVP